MNILMVGCGVIGTVYGWCLSEAGHQVSHLIRPNKLERFKHGISLDIYDLRSAQELSVTDQMAMKLLEEAGRGSALKSDTVSSNNNHPREQMLSYQPNLVSELSQPFHYDLVIVPTQHAQVIAALQQLKPVLGDTPVLIFCANWGDLSDIDALLPRSQYLLAYPASSGGYDDSGTMVVNIRHDYRIGQLQGNDHQLLKPIVSLFADADFVPDYKSNMLEWLWVHHAINGSTIGAMIYAGGFDCITEPNDEFAELFYNATMDAVNVLKARGVDTDAYPDVLAFTCQSPRQVLDRYHDLFVNTEIGKRTIQAGHHKHSAKEMQQYYTDVVDMAHELGVDVPALDAMEEQVFENIKRMSAH